MISMRGMFHLPSTLTIEDWRALSIEEIEQQLIEFADKEYEEKTRQLRDLMPQAERLTLLRAVDSHWIRHLTDLDNLREGIGLRAFGQQNPVIAYKREAAEMYDNMLGSIRSQVARDIYRVQAAPSVAQSPARNLRTNTASSSGGKGAKPIKSVSPEAIGRNDLCPCGSGKKFKHCHGAPGAQPLSTQQLAAAATRSATPVKTRK
jgi:preprotein translocase subunit SecA